MNTCSVENCQYECFEKKDKCILHCEKDDWQKINKNHQVEWDTNKVKLFWKKINNEINVITDAKIQNIEIFEEMIKEYNYEHFKYKFEKVIFPISIFDLPDYTSFHGLDRDIDIQFIGCKFLSAADFSLLNKAKNINFRNCEFLSSINFENMKFDNKFFLESCVVHDNMNFINIVFTDVTSFMNSEFYKQLNFSHSRFDDLALFNLLKAGRLFLGNTFFRKEANFLSMNISVHDRETARIIKDSFEKQNNIIEANKFYALEVKERENELTRDIKNKEKRDFKTFIDYIIFKLHGISSNHSQDPFLAFYWIIVFGITASLYEVYLLCTCSFSIINMITVNLFISGPIVINRVIETNIDRYTKYYLFVLYFLNYFFIVINCSPIKLENTVSFAKTINPFSIMKGTDDINMVQLFFKITIAYLVYQFIVSVRQNTRRK